MEKPVTLVTGCSSGIGLATAVELARAGHKVYATMRDLGKKGPLLEACAAAGVEVTLLPLDLVDPATIAAAAERVLAEDGRLTNLVNNAGFPYLGVLEDFSDADEAYEALGGVLGGSTPSSEINWGRTAQNALVSYVVQSLRDQGMSNQELFDAAHGETVDFSGLTSPFDGVNDTHVTEILDAAGMGGLLA